MEGHIRKRNNQSRLVSSGYAWTETRPAVKLAANVLLGGGALGIAMTVASFFEPIMDVWVWALMGVIGLPAGYLVFRYRFGQCGYIFHEQGVIEAPYGMPWPDIWKKQLRYAAADAKSVGLLLNAEESNNNARFHSVVLYLKNGDIVHLTSKDYKFEFAHKVATELTNALEELRAPRKDAKY